MDFQPFWLRVILLERPDESNRLLLASHGRSLPIADFLGAPMRRELADTLRAVLSRWRAALNPANKAGNPGQGNARTRRPSQRCSVCTFSADCSAKFLFPIGAVIGLAAGCSI